METTAVATTTEARTLIARIVYGNYKAETVEGFRFPAVKGSAGVVTIQFSDGDTQRCRMFDSNAGCESLDKWLRHWVGHGKTIRSQWASEKPQIVRF